MSNDVDVEIWYYPMQKELEILSKRFKKQMRGGEYYFHVDELDGEFNPENKVKLVLIRVGIGVFFTIMSFGLGLPIIIGLPIYEHLKKKRKLKAARLKIVEDHQHPELVAERIAKAKETLDEMLEIGKRHPCAFYFVNRQTIRDLVAYHGKFFSEAEKQQIEQSFREIDEFSKTRKEEATVRIM